YRRVTAEGPGPERRKPLPLRATGARSRAGSVGLSDRGAARGLPGPATAGPAVGVSTGGVGPAKLGQGTGLLLADRQSVGEHLAKLLGPHHRHRPRIRASR